MQFSLESTRQILFDNPHYRINELGEVFSNFSGSWKLLAPYYNKKRKQLSVLLRPYPGVKKAFRVHRLLYQLFVADIPKNIEIDHIDCNPAANHLNNLQIITTKENAQRVVRFSRNLVLNNNTGIIIKHL